LLGTLKKDVAECVGIKVELKIHDVTSRHVTIRTTLIKPLPAMAPVLLTLAQQHRLMLISSNSAEVIHVLLTRMDVSECFEAVMGADFLLNKTEKIVCAQNSSGFSTENIYYVGDTAGDIREARRAGIRSVAVTWGWHDRAALEAVAPDFLIDSPQALLNLLLWETSSHGC